MSSIALVWFRQDLRLEDNPALYWACQNHDQIIPVYILDTNFSSLGAAQLWWLHHSLTSLSISLAKSGTHLILKKGDSLECLTKLINTYDIKHIYWNRCYEPDIIKRDTHIKSQLKSLGCHVQTENSFLLNEPWTIKTKTDQYYKVFTPFWRACQEQSILPPAYNLNQIPGLPNNLDQKQSENLENWNLLPSKPNWASTFSEYWNPGEQGAKQKLICFLQDTVWDNYDINRDRPDLSGTSRLSPHLHFGEIGPRQIVRAIQQLNPTSPHALQSLKRFNAELGWREFSYHLLYHFPTLPNANFKTNFDSFPWHDNQKNLTAWRKGLTGYPIVDAGMRELWQTGFMHNRVRMIVASFLTKDLFIDWRIGASWFMHTLLDADLANNSAGWQWVAGCGADAAPYFRVFNPTLQGQKFDPGAHYIKKWIPELKNLPPNFAHEPWKAPNVWKDFLIKAKYPAPIVQHDESRSKALYYYQQLKNCNNSYL